MCEKDGSRREVWLNRYFSAVALKVPGFLITYFRGQLSVQPGVL